METFLLFFTIIMILLAVRNEVAFRIRMKANDIIFSRSDWEAVLARYRADKSYNQVMFDLTCWTAKQAYPWLFDKHGSHEPAHG